MEGRRMAAVNWLWMLLLLALCCAVSCIQIAIEGGSTNTSSVKTSNNANLTPIVGDSVLSASERNRRLIPYMAFYLPAPEFPINQQYAFQRVKGAKNPQQLGIPSAYVRMKLTGSAGSVPSSYTGPAQYPSTAGDVYHAISYQQHPLPQGPAKQHPQQQLQPILHLLPPGPSAGGGLTSYTTTTGGIKIHKQKTVQHFPPTSPPPQVVQTSSSVAPIPPAPQQQQQRHAHHYRHPSSEQQQPQQQTKQSKFNLTPFTSSNILPGHFVPIIYAPVSSSGNINNQLNSNSYKDAAQTTAINAEQQDGPSQSQHQRNNNNKAYPPQQQPVEYYESDGAAQLSPQPQPPSHSAIYHHVIDEAASPPPSSPSASSSSPSASSSGAQQQQQLQPVKKYHHRRPSNSKHANYQTPKFENFYSDDQQQQQQRPLLPPQQQQHYHVVDNDGHIMTPQEKYVLYLQQRMRYNKQRDHLKQRERESSRLKPSHIFVVSTTTAPPLNQGEEQLGGGQQPDLDDGPMQLQQYPQHSPVGHAVYSRPELPVPPNHQFSTTKATQPHVDGGQPAQQHVVHIPVRNIVDGLDAFLNQHRHATPQFVQHPASHHAHSTHQTHHQQALTGKSPQTHYANGIISSSSSSTTTSGNKNHQNTKTQYIDYIIDEPKQSLDEDHHHRPGYILVSTVAPPPSHQQQQHYISTTRPPIRQQPTLRLHPVPPQPALFKVSPSPPKDVYISPKSKPIQQYAQVYTTPAPPPQPLLNDVTNRRPAVTTLVPLTNRQHFKTTPQEVPISSSTERTHNKYDNRYDEELIMKQQQPQQQQQQYQQPIELTQLTPPSSNKHHEANIEPPHYHQRPQNQPHSSQPLNDPNQLPDIRSSSLAEILHKLQETNHLPQTLTPDNIDNSIKTLVTILENLKQTQQITPNPSQHHDKPSDHDYDDYANGSDVEEVGPAIAGGIHNQHDDDDDDDDAHKEHQLNAVLTPSREGPNKHPGPSTGRPGIDYPNYSEIPATSFDCTEQRYKGFFGDPETNCQVWHYCDLNGGKASFLCPNGTIFSQIALTCDWWFNVKCSTTAQLYVLNERLYKYILPFTPKFPEDYSGPLVDKYLALKFQEMEEKMRLEKEKAAAAMQAAAESINESAEDKDENLLKEAISQQATVTAPQAPSKHITINSQVREQSSERNLLIDDEEDDVSHRAASDKIPETSTTTATTTGLTTRGTVPPPPLSVKPIVVSSTIGPDYDDVVSAEQNPERLESMRNAQIQQQQTAPLMTTYIATEDAQHAESTQHGGHATAKRRQPDADDETSSSKVSVEKVEVIEIKTDGNTGHLMPSDIFLQAPSAEQDVQAENKLNSA